MVMTCSLTLGQLADIALTSNTELLPIHRNILLQLFNILFQKLNCCGEIVVIEGQDVPKIQNELRKVKRSKISIKPHEPETVAKLNDKLVILDYKIKTLELKLKDYMDDYAENTRCLRIPKSYDILLNEKTAEACEDLYTTCEPENSLGCQLVQNKTFIKKLTRFIGYPLLERIQRHDEQMSEMQEAIGILEKRVTDQTIRLTRIVELCKIVEGLQAKISRDNEVFLETMEEIQEMMDGKMDKLYLPPLKKYLRERFEKAEERLDNLEQEKSCPRAGGVIMNNLMCLSCGNKKVSIEKCALDRFPKFPGGSLPAPNPKDCTCCNKTKYLEEKEKIIPMIEIPSDGTLKAKVSVSLNSDTRSSRASRRVSFSN